MSLENSYEVLDMLRDDGVQTFRAKEKATGRGLELHLFPPFGRPDNKVLYDKLKALPLDLRRRFLDMGVDGSTPFVVTDPLQAGVGFKAWAEELFGSAKSAPSVFRPPAAAPTPDDGVQILQAGQWRTGTPIPESLVIKPAPPPAPPPAMPTIAGGDFTAMFQAPLSQQPAASNAGEFTSMFQAVDPLKATKKEVPTDELEMPVGEFTGLFKAHSPTPVATSAPPSAPPSIPQPAPPAPFAAQPPAGEFTSMFQAPPPAPPPFQPPFHPPEQPAGGEFTKFFESPLAPPPAGAPRPMIDVPPPPPPQAGQRVGEFTDIFGQPSTGPAPIAPPPQAGVFGAMPSATGQFSAQTPWSQPQAPPMFPSGPSEYTKMMGAPAIPTLGQPGPGQQPSAFGPAPGAPIDAPLKKASNPLIFIALGVAIVLVIAIIVFLVTRQAPPVAR